ncbi:E3 binding domain-containing protein [Mesorhizobium australicum]|uniref:E3 binding domain-containing protein n=1 Tax=Mesorhizobium australicum TaxID=536018 RepID=UPI00333D63C3
MNMTVAQTQRLAVSPYARRLARERDLPLSTLRGSGPGGRILAADVLSFVAISTHDIPPAAAPTIAAPRIAAFAASITLGALKDLLGAIEVLGKSLDFDEILLRAVGRAFAEVSDAAKGGAVALELAGRQAVFATVPEMPLTSLRAVRRAILTDNRDDADKPAVLSLQLLPASDIRPLAMPLLPGRAMRLTISINTAGDHAECLLTIDAASVDETAAVAWFATLKSAIEHPLRLFV